MSNKNGRVKFAVLNSSFSIIYSIINMILKFLIRKVFLDKFGLEILGYNSTFNSILGFLNLAELGIGTAITYKLYEPIANKDYDTVNSYLLLYMKLYRSIAIFIAGVGCVLIPFLPLFVKENYNRLLFLTIIYLLQLAATVVTYLLAYRRIILSVVQQNYVSCIIDLICLIMVSAIQVIIMCLTGNYYLYLVSTIFQVVISNILISNYSKKKYPMIRTSKQGATYKEKVNNLKEDLSNVVVSKIGGYVLNSTDSLVISMVMGSKYTGLMDNYRAIFISFQSMIITALTSIQPTLGNKIVCDTNKERIEQVICKITFLAQLIGGIFGCVSIFLVEPFIAIWLSSEYVLSNVVTTFFALNAYIFILMYPISLLFGALGYFNYDKKYVFLSAFLNIVISIILVKKYGICGVLIGTFIALLVYWISRVIILYKRYYGYSMNNYLKLIVRCVLSTVSSYSILYLINNRININSIRDFLLCGLFYVIIIFLVNLVLFVNCGYVKYYYELVIRRLRK